MDQQNGQTRNAGHGKPFTWENWRERRLKVDRRFRDATADKTWRDVVLRKKSSAEYSVPWMAQRQSSGREPSDRSSVIPSAAARTW